MMKGNNGQVQTVSIIDTISELANNQGDRAKLTQLSKSSRNQSPGNASRISTRNQSPGRAANLQLQLAPNSRLPPSPPSGPRSHPPPPPLNPRSPKVTVPSNLLATNINIGPQSFKQMSLTSRTSPSSQYNGSNYSVNKLGNIHVNGLVRPNFDEFSSGLGKAPYLNSTLKIDSDSDRRRRRVKKPRSNIRVGRGQGETPDWIRELFGFARKGNLDRLVSLLLQADRDPWSWQTKIKHDYYQYWLILLCIKMEKIIIKIELRCGRMSISSAPPPTMRWSVLVITEHLMFWFCTKYCRDASWETVHLYCQNITMAFINRQTTNINLKVTEFPQSDSFLHLVSSVPL